MMSVIKQSNAAGYAQNVFEGKNEQMKQVCNYISEKGFVPADLVVSEVSWFYGYYITNLETWVLMTCTFSKKRQRLLANI